MSLSMKYMQVSSLIVSTRNRDEKEKHVFILVHSHGITSVSTVTIFETINKNGRI